MASPFPSSNASELESTIDEYARKNGLSLDSTLDPLSFLSSIAHLDDHGPSHSAAVLLEDHIGLPCLQVPSVVSLREQPSISKASLEVLNTAMRREDDKDVSNLTLLASQAIRSRCSKLELPLLRSDHESDCRELERAIEARATPHIQKYSLPCEPLIVSQDEALDFPGSAYSYRDELEAAASTDRLALPRDVLQYLGMTLRDSWSFADTAKLLSNEITALRASFKDTEFHVDSLTCFQQIARTIRLTPPLSPLPTAHSFFVPDPDVCQIPLSSDPSTLFGPDLDEAHAALVEPRSSPPPCKTVDLSPLGDAPRISPTLANISSIKVEGPLTPVSSSEPTSDQVLDVTHTASGLELVQDVHELDTDLRRRTQDMFSDDLMETLREGAAQASRHVDQERLEVTDAIARVEIPVMDFTLPEPGWNEYDSNSRRQLDQIMANIESRRVPKWPRDSGAESQMRWCPFPSSLGQVSLRESIEEEVDLQSLLNFPCQKDVPNSSAYVWKQPGLSILRDPEDEEELDSPRCQLRSNADSESLVKKRKFETELNSANVPTKSSFSARASLINVDKAPKMLLTSLRDDLVPENPASSLLCADNDPSATSTLLANYVDIQTSKRRKNAKSSFRRTLEPIKSNTNANTNATATLKPAEPRLENQGYAFPPEIAIIPAPCPEPATGGVPADIIIAITLGSGIISLVENLLPNVKIIERDFDRYNVTTWDRNSVSRTPIVSPLAAEADVVISPETGVVITTLIRAIQKPLPGHKGKAAIRERIEKIADRYERIIVLVSAANRFDESVGHISTSECAALSDFIGFVAGLDTNGQVYFVGGGDETLSNWLAFFITRYSIKVDDVKGLLITNETTWEVALRRAGLNAFAAQVILATMKPPEGTPEEAMGKYGLSGFIKMSPTQRLQEFGQLMGGGRVLQRVAAMLDSEWA